MWVLGDVGLFTYSESLRARRDFGRDPSLPPASATSMPNAHLDSTCLHLVRVSSLLLKAVHVSSDNWNNWKTMLDSLGNAPPILTEGKQGQDRYEETVPQYSYSQWLLSTCYIHSHNLQKLYEVMFVVVRRKLKHKEVKALV